MSGTSGRRVCPSALGPAATAGDAGGVSEPRGPERAGGGFLVVGVDGSECARKALRWAYDYAVPAGLAMRVVVAWQVPTAYGWGGAIVDVDFEAQADRELRATVAEVVGDAPEVDVRCLALQGPAAPTLLAAAEAADLLVVGSRGRGGMAGLLLGSVSTACLHHASCPVVVVPCRSDA
jgi:nucleotide-binding universal stress UspA family protein